MAKEILIKNLVGSLGGIKRKRPKISRRKNKFPVGTDLVLIKKGSIEGMEDATKIEGKPHSSPEGKFSSEIRSSPFKLRIARRGGGRAYGKNSWWKIK